MQNLNFLTYKFENKCASRNKNVSGVLQQEFNSVNDYREIHVGQRKKPMLLVASLMLMLTPISFERHVANVAWGLEQDGHVEVECVDESGDPVEVAEVFLFQFNGDRLRSRNTDCGPMAYISIIFF